MLLQLDTKRAFGLYGGTFNVSALQFHGRNLSADNLGTLQTASGIEADRATRLWELWYQQKFLDEDRLDMKIGQQSLDQEFMVSQNALLLRQHHVRLADAAVGRHARRRSGLSAVGAGRARARRVPIDSITVLAGVFNGSPVANNAGDPQRAQPVGHQLSAERRRAGDRRTAISPIPSLGTHGLGRPERAARAHLQDRRLVRHRKLRRPALSTTPACRSPIPRATAMPAAASRRLRHLRRRRSDDLARSRTSPTAPSTSSRARWARRRAIAT